MLIQVLLVVRGLVHTVLFLLMMFLRMVIVLMRMFRMKVWFRLIFAICVGYFWLFSSGEVFCSFQVFVFFLREVFLRRSLIDWKENFCLLFSCILQNF